MSIRRRSAAGIRLLPVVAISALALTIAVGVVSASSPPAGAVTVPSAAGQSANDRWTGTIAPGANAASDCSPPSTSPADEHTVSVTVPAGVYAALDATFTFSITWKPSSPSTTTSDEILTVIGPNGVEVGSSDGSGTTETVTATNLPSGTYRVLACGFANAAPQPYDGSLVVTTASAEASVPSAPAQGLQFSAAVPADPQRDQAEPLMTIGPDGHIYTCGPTGFSQSADYSQVSTDGGDQFHLLGTPPRGQGSAGGGGDCALAVDHQRNGQGSFQLDYAGLGALSGFATSTSPNDGHSIATGGFDVAGGATNKGALADRQWLVFVGGHASLLSYNQQEPRNTVVLRSNDGLTYDVAHAAYGARNPRFPGPMGYDAVRGIAYFGWDRTGSDGDHINLSISRDGGRTWTDCQAALSAGNAAGFVTSASDSAGNIYVAYTDSSRYHTYLVTLAAANVGKCNQSVDASSAMPTVNPGFSRPVQVDRDAVRTTVFPWLAAGPEPGRVAVAFYGTETDGNPNVGTFKASWDVYVNQSLNALSTDPLNPPTFSQVKATTHPFHYDSICLNGLGCDLAVPPGDRSLADFFAIGYNPVTDKLSVVFDRGNKKPDEAAGHVATPMVVTQIGGPTMSGKTLTPAVPVVRTSSTDPTGDALSSYSLLAPGTPPPPPPTANEPAADFTSVSVGPEVDFFDGGPSHGGGFTVTMKLADLSTPSLLATLARTGSQSLLWLFRFTNGYQDAAASARWNPVQGFTFGFNDYTLGSSPCLSTGSVTTEKCVIYPGGTPIQGSVDQSTGTIRLSVDAYLLRALSGGTGPGQRPAEVPASVGSRFYDAEAFSLGNTLSPVQDVQSFLYPLDNTPAMDFLLPGAAQGGGGSGCKVEGGGSSGGASDAGSNDARFTVDALAALPARGYVAYRDRSAGVDFHSTQVDGVSCDGTHGTVSGRGRNGNDASVFSLTAVDNGTTQTDTFLLTLGSPAGYTRTFTVRSGDVLVRR